MKLRFVTFLVVDKFRHVHTTPTRTEMVSWSIIFMSEDRDSSGTNSFIKDRVLFLLSYIDWCGSMCRYRKMRDKLCWRWC